MTIGSAWTLDAVLAAARERGRPARVQVKVDTGLARNGILTDWSELVHAVARAEAEGAITVHGVWSHFAYADAPSTPRCGPSRSASSRRVPSSSAPVCDRRCATSPTLPRR